MRTVLVEQSASISSVNIAPMLKLNITKFQNSCYQLKNAYNLILRETKDLHCLLDKNNRQLISTAIDWLHITISNSKNSV